MSSVMRSIAVAAAASAVLAIPSQPASAIIPICAGTSSTLVVCAEAGTGGVVYTDCVFVGPPPCVPVTIRTPKFTVGGDWQRDTFDPIWCPFVMAFPPPFTTVGQDGDTTGMFEHDCPPYQS